MTLSNKPIVVAKVGRPHGLRGALKCHSFTTDPSVVLSFKEWLIRLPNKAWQPAPKLKIMRKGQGFLVQFEACQDRNLAQQYVNAELAVEREQLADVNVEEDGYYWADLEGLLVENLQGHPFGKVAYLIETGANDVLVVQGDSGEVLIPFLETVIHSVDDEKIIVDWDDVTS